MTQEKTIEEYQAEINRGNKMLQYLASSKADDAIFIAEYKAVIDEQEQIIQHQQNENERLKAENTKLERENQSLKSYLEQATAPSTESDGEVEDEITINQ